MIAGHLLHAQSPQGITQTGVPTGQPRFPLHTYKELPDPKRPHADSWKSVEKTHVAWGDTDTRYPKHAVPRSFIGQTLKLKGWKGERLNAQAVVWSKKGVEKLAYRFSRFQHTGKKAVYLGAEVFRPSFVRYVMTDQLNHDGKGGCGERIASRFDSTLVADVLDHTITSISLSAESVQPLWIEVALPREIVAGTYRGEVQVLGDGEVLATLPLSIEVVNRTLPEPKDWAFHLDLWQNPYAVARYHQVSVWSDAHISAMKPVMQRLADAGQKVITASIMHKPWDGQTEDYFESMVTWIKKADGTWQFDFTVFDKWVTFMQQLGIDQQINCYSMVPWKLSFQYFDQATNSLQFINTQPGEAIYEELWVAMLRSFSQHLREKGWFEKCTIAMDERPMEVMQQTLTVIRKADPAFRVSLAGNYHPELQAELYDYCIAIGQTFPKEVLTQRQSSGKKSTVYTSCAEAYPNTFTFSAPAEATWIGFHVANKGLDGYLRWAYNSWTLEPLLDSRFRTWAAGDCYLVYPEARSSIRFQRLIEGIQAYEKVRLLREESIRKGHRAGISRLERLLHPFSLEQLSTTSVEGTVRTAQRALNEW